jgi:hypothetical protein
LTHLSGFVLGGRRGAGVAVNHDFILHLKSASKKRQCFEWRHYITKILRPKISANLMHRVQSEHWGFSAAAAMMAPPRQ